MFDRLRAILIRARRAVPVREALEWSRTEPIGWREIAIGALGMAAPVAVGVTAGQAQLGFTVGLGAMLLAGGSGGPAAESGQRAPPGTAVAPALLAVVAATAIAGAAWTDAAMIALAGGAATLTNYSRPLAVAAIRFMIYLVLSVGLLDAAGPHRGLAALVFGLGALWNVAVRVMLARAHPVPAPPLTGRAPTAAQRRAHWRRTLRTLVGWQFPVRLIAGLSVASMVRHAWPTQHYFWVVLSVALLTQRPLEHVPVKIIQRTLGTVAGVGVTWAMLSGVSSPVVLAVLICVLAALAPIARARSYLAYSVVSTPVILLVLDLGKPIERALLTDRIVATLIGATIVIVANVVLEQVLRRNAPASG